MIIASSISLFVVYNVFSHTHCSFFVSSVDCQLLQIPLRKHMTVNTILSINIFVIKHFGR